MRRFVLDSGIAGDYIDRRRGVFEHARDEVAKGNRIGILVTQREQPDFSGQLITDSPRPALST